MSTEAIEEGGQELTGTERDRIIRKIKRCLALGASSNPNEAEMAMRQAQAMMANYRLSEADVNASGVGTDERNTGIKTLPRWHSDLVCAAAEAFGCRVIFKGRMASEPLCIRFIGVMPAAELAAYAYDSLLAQAKIARRKVSAEFGPVRPSTLNDFSMGWVAAIFQKLTTFAESTGPASANALMVIRQKDDAAIAAWMEVEHAGIKQKRNSALRHKVNGMAVLEGVKSGKLAQINHGIGQAANGQLALEHAA